MESLLHAKVFVRYEGSIYYEISDRDMKLEDGA